MPPKRKRKDTVTESETQMKVNKKDTSTRKTSKQGSTSSARESTSSIHQPISKMRDPWSSTPRVTRGFLRSSTLSKTDFPTKQPPRWMTLLEEVLLPDHVSGDSLTDACYKGQLGVVKELLVSGAGINKTNEEGWTPLMIAAYTGHKQLFDLLLKHGCYSTGTLTNGNNILHLACLGGNSHIVDYIVSHKMADIESKESYGRTPLMKAAMVGVKDIFDLLLSKGCDLSRKDDFQNTILHLACFSDNLEIVKYIITRNVAEIDSVSGYKRTPVMFAALGGNRKVFDFLARKGCDFSGVDGDGNTILHQACYGGCVDIIQYLITNHIVDINTRGQFGRTPVMTAVDSGNDTKSVFDVFIREGCDLTTVDDDGDNILHIACAFGCIDVVEYVVTHNIVSIESKGERGRTPVMNAALNGSKEIVELLVSKGCDLSSVDNPGDNALHLACYCTDNVETVQYLIECGGLGIDSRGEDGRTPVMLAAMMKRKNVFDLLVRKGCNLSTVDDEGNTILHLACYFTDHVEIVQKLIDIGGVGIDTRGENGRTPVMFAAEMGQKNVLDLLMRKDCNLSTVDDDRNTILHLACYFTDHVEIVQKLTDTGAIGIDTPGEDRKTPVMFAAEMGQKNVFDLLVRKECDLSLTDRYGNNILHLACKSDSVDIVEYLISHNIADINSRGYKGKTPVMFAAEKDQKRVYELLKSKGCDLSIVDDNGNQAGPLFSKLS